jgi:hypothetical protein
MSAEWEIRSRKEWCEIHHGMDYMDEGSCLRCEAVAGTMKATHVVVIETIDLATGRGEIRREYGYYGPYEPSQYGQEWIVTHEREPMPLSRSADQVQTWARNDGVEW